LPITPQKNILKILPSSLNIPEEALILYGNDKAKINYDFLDSCKDKKDGKLILVTAISPTPAGEGKTTTSVGLVDGLCHIGKKAMVCLREPSLGPCFGMKGGAAGGGYAQGSANDRYKLAFHLEIFMQLALLTTFYQQLLTIIFIGKIV
jgi:formate--tetrahydrofolate ligase